MSHAYTTVNGEWVQLPKGILAFISRLSSPYVLALFDGKGSGACLEISRTVKCLAFSTHIRRLTARGPGYIPIRDFMSSIEHNCYNCKYRLYQQFEIHCPWKMDYEKK